MAEYQKIYINGNETKMKEAFDTLVTIGLADHVTLEHNGSSQPVIDIYDENNNSMFTITNYTTFVGRNADGDTVTIPKTSYSASNDSTKIWTYVLKNAFTCRNGIIFTMNAVQGGQNPGQVLSNWIMFTGNSATTGAGRPVPVMIGCGPADYNYTTDGTVVRNAMNIQYVSCWTDDSPMNTIPAAAPTQTNQCILVPFFTTAKVDEVSYTPYAGRFMAGNMNQLITDSEIHVISFNNARWLTNGYWALQL